jgi:hypothetical protein
MHGWTLSLGLAIRGIELIVAPLAYSSLSPSSPPPLRRLYLGLPLSIPNPATPVYLSTPSAAIDTPATPWNPLNHHHRTPTATPVVTSSPFILTSRQIIVIHRPPLASSP